MLKNAILLKFQLFRRALPVQPTGPGNFIDNVTLYLPLLLHLEHSLSLEASHLLPRPPAHVAGDLVRLGSDGPVFKSRLDWVF
jgi:hypothetical protein